MPRVQRVGWRWLLALALLVAGLGGAGFAGRPTQAAPASGLVWAWGTNNQGQVGTTPGTATYSARTVTKLASVVGVSAGAQHSLAVKADGTVWSWGADGDGQIGDGTLGNPQRNPVPRQVPGLSWIVAVSGGFLHSMALKSDGTVWTWGDNVAGQLGDGTMTKRATPVQVSGLADVRAISARRYHSMALKNDGTVWAWGSQFAGVLGDGVDNSVGRQLTPTRSRTLTGVVAIGAGAAHSLTLKSDGTVWAWGQGYYGQLGNNAANNSTAPIQVPGLAGVQGISAGYEFSLALKSDGTVWSWGHDEYAQLGDGTAAAPEIRPMAQQVPGLSGVSVVSAGRYSAVALKTDGTTWTWGYDGNGQLSDGKPNFPSLQPTPVLLQGVVGGIAASVGEFQGLVLVPPVTPNFGDVPSGGPAETAIRELATRGVIKGCDQSATPLFCPNEPTLRAQMAALIARSIGWDLEDHENRFPDRCLPNNGGCIDDALWRNVGTLQHYKVAKGFSDGTYNPFGEVLYAQTISFITRAMEMGGYWTPAANDDPSIYPNIPANSGHRLDFVTYVTNVGPVPGTSSATQNFDQWNQPSTRAWFAQALWQALPDSR